MKICLGKLAVGVVRESRNFKGTHIWGALSGHLYIRQVNGVKLADITFSLLSVCLCAQCVGTQPTASN